MRVIVDCHVHIGPSLSLGVNVSSEDVVQQMGSASISKAVVFPFPSKALSDPAVNQWVLSQCLKHKLFYPFYYVLDDLAPPPRGSPFLGVKWHWVRGISDLKSNYAVLSDPRLEGFAQAMESAGIPAIFEEELNFTRRFADLFPRVVLIVPHMGMLGGNPLDFLKAFKEAENVYFDTSLAPPSTIRSFVDKVGPRRVLFGSDTPFGTMKGEVGKIFKLSLTHDELEAVLGGNILRLIEKG